jgi:hypothetical protein
VHDLKGRSRLAHLTTQRTMTTSPLKRVGTKKQQCKLLILIIINNSPNIVVCPPVTAEGARACHSQQAAGCMPGCQWHKEIAACWLHAQRTNRLPAAQQVPWTGSEHLPLIQGAVLSSATSTRIDTINADAEDDAKQ